MSMDFKSRLLQKAVTAPKRVVFPEGGEEKILRAAYQVKQMGIAYPIIIGKEETIAAFAGELGISLEGFTIVDHAKEEKCEQYINEFLKINTDFSPASLKRKLKNPLYFAAMMVKLGEADCLAAGIGYTTGEVILASQTIIGLEEGISTVSSIGILEIPGFEGSEGNLLAISDCAVCPAPDSSELADIAIASSNTVQSLLGWEPRVGMLSFSTKGSAQHESADKVIKAVELAKARCPKLKIDGEFQLDSAILPSAAAKKVPGGSEVAGRANIIVFPDLGAGNIGVKLVQIFAKCSAHGPLLQGFSKPVTDFSRSAPIDEMVGAIAMVVVRAQE